VRHGTRNGPAGVYVLYREDGSVLYVGAANNVGRRLAEHIASAEWWPEVASARFEHFDHRTDAMDRERWLIERLNPAHNKQYVLPKPPAHTVPEQQVAS
jgi:predicted GIY-YIG superfamily endonuclease